MQSMELGTHGAVRRCDALARWGPYRVRAALESGEWHTLWPGVLVEADRVADPLTLAAAAVQLGGPDVLLTGPTAARLHGCSTAEPVPVHITAPYGHWIRSRRGLKVHSGIALSADRETVASLPVLCLDRVLTDLLCRARPPDALAVLDEALSLAGSGGREQLRARVGERLRHRRDPRGTRCAGRILELATGRAESPAESWLLWLVVDLGFPPPQVNWSLTGVDGREVYRLDLAWPELRITAEYDGHSAHAARSVEDDARAEDLRRRGWIVVRVRVADLQAPTRLDTELVEAFRRRGVDLSGRVAGLLRRRRHREPRGPGADRTDSPTRSHR